MGSGEPELLLGGNKSGAVVRVGDTVRRNVGASSPIVHELLLHLEARGFEGAPRFLGFDSAGREILTFHPGVLMAEHPDHGDDRLLVDLSGLVRGFHEAASGFEPPSGQPRWMGSVDPLGGTLVLHGDLAPWNVIVGADHMTLIDWDDLWVGRVEWEIAYVLHTSIPFWPDARSDHDTVRRIRLFADAYGLTDATLRSSLELVPSRCRRVGHANRVHADMGDDAFVRGVSQGLDDYWLSSADHVEQRLPVWLHALGI